MESSFAALRPVINSTCCLWSRQMNMEDEQQLLNARDSKSPGSYSCLRFTVVVLTLVLIVATSAIVGLAVGLGVSVAANGRISHRTSSSSSSSSIISSSASPPHTSTVLPSPSPSPSPTPTNTVCMTESCVTLAALVLDNMDRSIDPCEDFYNFS
ncbi:Endothelin-converting enzyme 2, partial [Geodia barretti]